MRGDLNGKNGLENRNGPHAVRVGRGGDWNGGASNGNGIAGGNEGDPSPVIANMIAPFLQRNPRPRSVMIAKQMLTPAAGDEEEMGLFYRLYLENSSEQYSRQTDSFLANLEYL